MKKLTAVAVVVLGLSTAAFACGGQGGGCGMKQQKGMDCQKHMGEQKQGMGCQKHMGMQKGGEKKHKMFAIIKRLNLSDEQMAKLKEIRQSKMQSHRALKLEKRAAKASGMNGMDISKFMTAEKFDKDAFRAILTKKMEEKRAKMQKIKTAKINTKVDTMEKLFNLLTPEQRVALIEQSKK